MSRLKSGSWVRWTIFAQLVFGYSPYRWVWNLCLMLASSCLQGIGLLLLIPLLQIVGVQGNATHGNAVFIRFEQLFSSIGIPLTLAWVLFGYCLLLTIEAIFSRYKDLSIGWLRVSFAKHLQIRINRAIHQASWETLLNIRQADLIQLSDSIPSSLANAIMSTANLASSLVQVGVLLIVALQLAPSLTLLLLAAGIAFYLIFLPMYQRLSSQSRELIVTDRSLYRVLTGLLQNMKLIKSHAMEVQSMEDFQIKAESIRNHNHAYLNQTLNMQLCYRLLSVFFLVSSTWVAIEVLSTPTNILLVIILLTARLLLAVGQIHRRAQNLIHLGSTAITYQEMLVRLGEKQQINYLPKSKRYSFRKELSVCNLDFNYPNSKHPCLQGINFTLKANTMNFIVGESGSGKTTLIDLLIGLHKPVRGSISIDHRELGTDDAAGWRQAVAYVPQEFYFFHQSIRANLLWGNDHALAEDDLWHALSTSGGEGFVKDFTDSLDTIIGDRGIKISGGQRQRISLARALLRRPELLILDEALNALPTSDQQQIYQRLHALAKSMTILIVSHRLPSMSQFCPIYHLDNAHLKLLSN